MSTTKLLFLIATAWTVNGIYFVVRSGSRGAFADILFGALWPVYWYTDWRAGRWVFHPVDFIRLIAPSILVLMIASFAGLVR